MKVYKNVVAIESPDKPSAKNICLDKVRERRECNDQSVCDEDITEDECSDHVFIIKLELANLMD